MQNSAASATPASAATPASTTPPVTTPPAPGPAAPPAAAPAADTVTLSREEYNKLQRQSARASSKQRREALETKRTGSASTHQPDPNNPFADEIETERNARIAAEQKLAQATVQGGVRDILAKSEFKDIPESVKKIILRNPQGLSNATDPEEILLDVEDYLREEMNDLKASTTAASAAAAPAATHEAPPVSNSGAPVIPASVELEKLDGLTGPARTQAILRNQLKTARATTPGAI